MKTDKQIAAAAAEFAKRWKGRVCDRYQSLVTLNKEELIRGINFVVS